MPANKGGDSKQGLIITMVGFILLSIILGVTTYYGYAGQAEFQKSAADAKKEADAAKKDRDWYKFVALRMRGYTGDLSKQENEEMTVKLEQYQSNQLSGDDKAIIDSLFKELNARLANETYRVKVARLEEELKNAQTSLQNEKNLLAKERAEHARLMEVKVAEVQQFEANLKKAEDDNLAGQKKAALDLTTRLQELDGVSDELAKTKKQTATEKQTLNKDKTRLSEEIKDQRNAIVKFQEAIKPPDLQKFSTPKGKIVSLDPRGQLAWIDLGEADHIRNQQGLTFSIFGQGTAGRGSKERKGALEVVNVMGPHLSMAKITETVDPRTNPMQTGDLLVNPAWSPTMQGHVAIAGLIDLAGDGRDHSDEFKRNLQKQNVVVDAYLDLKEATIKGKMDVKTDYLIVGEPPDFSSTTTFREGDTRFERKTDIMDKMTTMQVEAREKGITVVPLRRFVEITGYQLPQGARSTTGFSYESRIPRSSANGSAQERPGKKEKPKEEKKEEDK
jgi:hypothetical protein